LLFDFGHAPLALSSRRSGMALNSIPSSGLCSALGYQALSSKRDKFGFVLLNLDDKRRAILVRRCLYLTQTN